MAFDPRHSKWVAWLNLAAALITVVGVVDRFRQNSILGPLQHTVPVPVWALLAAVIFVPSITLIIDRLFTKASDSARLTALHTYASHPDLVRIIDVHGKEVVGGHADNFYWKEVATAICKSLGLQHLRYSNLGTQYHL